MFGKKKKKSFFEKLTGSITVDDFDDEFIEDDEFMDEDAMEDNSHEEDHVIENSISQPDDAGELSVDVMQTEDEIIIQAMVAGVKPSDLDLDISRDTVTISGTREEIHEISEDDYYHKELYWGSFERIITLPEEIDVDLAEAMEKHGLLTIRLPKLDKNRKTKLQVKTK
ncbi:MAG: HSP20 family protein [Candidatus Paceibacteria bacterium]|jgi:HSP20 family protein